MQLPDFAKKLKFWEGVSFIVAGILAVLVYFGKLGPEWALSASAVLAVVVAIFRWLGIELEARLRALIKEQEALNYELKRQLSLLASNSKPGKDERPKGRSR